MGMTHILQEDEAVMSVDWESIFSTWAQGPSDTEQQKADNAANQVRKAIESSDKLRHRNIKVFAQGSYRNRVNVKKDSDVDIGVLCFDTFFYESNDDNVLENLKRTTPGAVYTYDLFKNEIEQALIDRFGVMNVSRDNKSFDIKENTYRVEADVAAFFEHRRYRTSYDYLSGVELRPDNDSYKSICNWPEQHYESGVAKNTMTARRYKRVVRILKSLSNLMAEKNIESAKKAPSFLIECLVSNVPNRYFGSDTYYGNVTNVIEYLFQALDKNNGCDGWTEVSGLKYLFWYSQPWSKQDALNFVSNVRSVIC